MYLTYSLKLTRLTEAGILLPQYWFEAGDAFSLYKERFVIFSAAYQPEVITTCFFTYLFSYDNFWWRADSEKWNVERKRGLALFSDTLIFTILRQRRGFLLQYGQRRVVTRASRWFVSDIWTMWSFNAFVGSDTAIAGQYTYRHLAQSDLYSAGVLLGHPNFYFFVYVLSNPYFWSVLQQTLNSQYRFR